MTDKCDHIFTDVDRLFTKLGLRKPDKTKPPLLWVSDKLYEELKVEGIIKEQ